MKTILVSCLILLGSMASLAADDSRCVMQGNLFKTLSTSKWNMDVIPLAVAVERADCPKLKNYSDVMNEYHSLNLQGASLEAIAKASDISEGNETWWCDVRGFSIKYGCRTDLYSVKISADNIEEVQIKCGQEAASYREKLPKILKERYFIGENGAWTKHCPGGGGMWRPAHVHGYLKK